jgi:hypothetical protein
LRTSAQAAPLSFETDLVQADRDTIVRNFISGQYEDALRVVSFNVAEGWSRDVSEDIAGESSIAPTMRTRRLPTTPSDSSICILIISVDRGRHRCYASKIRSRRRRRRGSAPGAVLRYWRDGHQNTKA